MESILAFYSYPFSVNKFQKVYVGEKEGGADLCIKVELRNN